MNKTATFLRTWGWLIGALLILLLVLGNRSGCTKQEENEPLDLFQSAAEDLNSAYRKQLKAEKSRDRYFEGLDRFIGAQESEGLWGNDNRRTTSQHPQPSKEERDNTNCCDSATVNYGRGNQIVNVHVGDTESKEKSKTDAEVAKAPSKSSGTRTVVVREPTVTNNYYGYSKAETNRTVQEVQPKRSYDSSYEDYSSQRSETVTKSYGTTEEEDCWPTLKPSLVDKFGLHYKSDGRVYQRDGSLYKGKEQPFLGGVQSQDEASSSGSSRSSSYSSTTTSTSSSGGDLQLKPGYRRGPNGAVIDKNGNYAKEDPFIR